MTVVTKNNQKENPQKPKNELADKPKNLNKKDETKPSSSPVSNRPLSKPEEEEQEFPFLQNDEPIPILQGALMGNESMDEVVERNLYYSLNPDYNKNDDVRFLDEIYEDVERNPAWVEEKEGDPSWMDEIKGGLKYYYNNFASAVNDTLGTDLGKYKVDRDNFKDSATFDILGGHAGVIATDLAIWGGAGLATLAGAPIAIPALGALALTTGTSYLNSYIATYAPRKNLEQMNESGMIMLYEAFADERLHGFVPNDPKEREKLSRGELHHRMFLGDMFDYALTIATLGAAGKLGRLGFKGIKKTVGGLTGKNKKALVKQAKEAMPVDTSPNATKFAGQALDEGQDILDEQMIDNIAAITGEPKKEAVRYFNQITQKLESGDPLKLIEDKKLVDLINSGMKLGAGAREYALDKGLYRETLDIVQDLKRSQTALKERLTAEGRLPKPIGQGGVVEDISNAHIKRAGTRFDKALRGGEAFKKFKTDGNLQDLDDIIFDINEATINMPATVRTTELPTDAAKKQVAGKSTGKALPAVEPDTPTGAEMTGILTRKEELTETMLNMAVTGKDRTYLLKLIDMQNALDNLARVRATKAGGNLKRWQEIMDRTPEFKRLNEQAKIINAKVERGLMSSKAAQKKVDKLVKQLKQSQGLNYAAEFAASEAIRISVDDFLAQGAISKAIAGNIISPLLHSIGTTGITHPMKALKFAGQTTAINLRNALRLVGTKQGWGDIAGVYSGVKRTRNRFGLQNKSPEGMLHKGWHTFTNLYSGSMDLVDHATREGLELAAARSTIQDMITRRLRLGETPKEIVGDFKRILKGDKADMEVIIDYNRHLESTLDQMLFRGQNRLDYDNALGEGHNVLSLLSSFVGGIARTISDSYDTHIFKRSSAPAKLVTGPIKFLKDRSLVFINVPTQAMQFMSDYVPVLGARTRHGDSVLQNLGRMGVLNRKQLVGTTLVGTTWGINNLYEGYTGNKLIEFRFPDASDKLEFQKMGGREGIYVDGHFVEANTLPVIGDFIRIMNKGMGLLQYGYDAVAGEHELGAMERFKHIASEITEMIVGDTYLTKSFALALSDILQSRPEKNIKRIGENFYEVLRPWGRHVDKIEDTFYGRQSRTRSGFEYWQDKWDALRGELYDVEATLSDDVKYDIFGTPYSEGEDRMTTDTIFGHIGVLIRNGFYHAKGPTPKANQITDLLLVSGAFDAQDTFVINGKVIKKSLLPPELRPSFKAPKNFINLHPALTAGGENQREKLLNYRMRNRRDRLRGMDLKYTQSLIDDYLRFYQSLSSDSPMEQMRINRAINSLRNYKGYFNEGTLRGMVPSYKEGYNMVDTLHDVVMEKNPLHRSYVNNFAARYRNQMYQKNLHLDFTEEEIQELGSRAAKVHLLKLVFNTYSDMTDGLLGLDPELYKEAKELGFFENTEVRGR